MRRTGSSERKDAATPHRKSIDPPDKSFRGPFPKLTTCHPSSWQHTRLSLGWPGFAQCICPAELSASEHICVSVAALCMCGCISWVRDRGRGPLAHIIRVVLLTILAELARAKEEAVVHKLELEARLEVCAPPLSDAGEPARQICSQKACLEAIGNRLCCALLIGNRHCCALTLEGTGGSARPLSRSL